MSPQSIKASPLIYNDTIGLALSNLYERISGVHSCSSSKSVQSYNHSPADVSVSLVALAQSASVGLATSYKYSKLVEKFPGTVPLVNCMPIKSQLVGESENNLVKLESNAGSKAQGSFGAHTPPQVLVLYVPFISTIHSSPLPKSTHAKHCGTVICLKAPHSSACTNMYLVPELSLSPLVLLGKVIPATVGKTNPSVQL